MFRIPSIFLSFYCEEIRHLPLSDEVNSTVALMIIRDWSLITGWWGYKMGGGGACEVLPLQKWEQNKF